MVSGPIATTDLEGQGCHGSRQLAFCISQHLLRECRALPSAQEGSRNRAPSLASYEVLENSSGGPAIHQPSLWPLEKPAARGRGWSSTKRTRIKHESVANCASPMVYFPEAWLGSQGDTGAALGRVSDKASAARLGLRHPRVASLVPSLCPRGAAREPQAEEALPAPGHPRVPLPWASHWKGSWGNGSARWPDLLPSQPGQGLSYTQGRGKGSGHTILGTLQVTGAPEPAQGKTRAGKAGPARGEGGTGQSMPNSR